MKDVNGLQTLESMNQATWYNQWTLNKFEDFLSGDILEVGCGIGNFTTNLTSYGKVFAIDINNEYISIIKKTNNPKISAGIGDIEKNKFFFKDRKFDTIVCLNVLEHIKNDTSALQNIYNLLKPGGKLILLMPSHQSLYGKIDQSIGHFRRYDLKQLLEKIKGYRLRVIKAERINFIGALGWWFSGKVLKKNIVESGKIKIFNYLAPIFLPFESLVNIPIGTSILVVAEKNL